MKRRPLKFSAAFTLLLILFSAPCARANDNGPAVKLGRGLTNVVMGPTEMVTQVKEMGKKENAFTALFGGFFKGVGMFLVREVTGIYEIITFPIPIPRGYRPLTDPGRVPETASEGMRQAFEDPPQG